MKGTENGRRRDTRRRTKYLAVSAMLTALGVIIIWFGAMIDVLDLCTAALAAMLIIPVALEYGSFYPWTIYAATSALALLILPQKMPAVVYLLFGYYPVLKLYLEKLPKVWSWVCKEVLFLAVEYAVIRASDYLIGAEDMPLWYDLVLIVGGFAAVNLFDVALSRLMVVYRAKYQKRVARFMR